MTGPGAIHLRRIAHFTHLDNLVSIAARGALTCDRQAQKGQLVTEVGDPEIKASRRNRVVPVAPGGSVGDYVPFYYAPRSPMMYRIACDCRDSNSGRYQGGDRKLVFLCSTVGAIANSGLVWVATDGNAAAEISRFSTNLEEVEQMIDWPLMSAQMWHNTSEDQDRQRRRMAELLVHREMALSLVNEVAAYSDEEASKAAVALGGHVLAQSVVVRPSWYYGYERR
jgi:hypothetical protein